MVERVRAALTEAMSCEAERVCVRVRVRASMYMCPSVSVQKGSEQHQATG